MLDLDQWLRSSWYLRNHGTIRASHYLEQAHHLFKRKLWVFPLCGWFHLSWHLDLLGIDTDR